MEKKVLTENMEYQAPEVEIVEVAIERGFNYRYFFGTNNAIDKLKKL